MPLQSFAVLCFVQTHPVDARVAEELVRDRAVAEHLAAMAELGDGDARALGSRWYVEIPQVAGDAEVEGARLRAVVAGGKVAALEFSLIPGARAAAPAVIAERDAVSFALAALAPSSTICRP
jgi:hypothetical protein